jgi:hypothetical protein
MTSTHNIASSAPLITTADPNTRPYEAVRFNALKHGILSRYTVLSHESHADYESLVNSLDGRTLARRRDRATFD